MTYVSCTARLFFVSTDRSIKPTMQDGVGAIPMVAPAPTGASGNRANHVQCTQQRWNLKDRIQFPQWNLELVSLVRRQTDRNFPTSTPPSNPLEENDDNDGVHTRKYISTQELSATHALTIYAQ